MKHLYLLAALLLFSLAGNAQKKVVSPEIYDDWKDVNSTQISENGKFISYEINPQVGDGVLTVSQANGSNKQTFERAYKAKFSANSSFLVFQVKAHYDTIRNLKIKKTKKDKFPKDSVFVLNLSNNELTGFAKVMSSAVPIEESGWLAILLKAEEAKPDTSEKKKVKKKAKAPKSDPKTGTLIVLNPETGAKFEYKNVAEYSFSRNGKLLGFSTFTRDTVAAKSTVELFYTEKQENAGIFENTGLVKKLSLDNSGEQAAFLATEDTAKRKLYRLFYSKSNTSKAITDTIGTSLTSGYTASPNGKIYFSRNDERLFFGVAPKPRVEPKDTLLDDEKVKLDMWHWQDPLLQPQQLKQLKREQKRTYLTVFHVKTSKIVQLSTKCLNDVRPLGKGNAELAVAYNSKPYLHRMSWEMPGYRDMYAVNIETGDRKLLLTDIQSRCNLSPTGKYAYWYNNADSLWYAKDVATEKEVLLTGELGANLYVESHDYPQDPYPYGIAAWSENDKYVLVYDKYDIWKIDPTGTEKAVNLTNGYGRENQITFRYLSLDRDKEFVAEKGLFLLSAFNEKTKESGYFSASLKGGAPKKLTMDAAMYRSIAKAKNTENLVWQRGNFNEYYNVWTSDLNFRKAKKITDANPQQSEYKWGSVELVKWISTEGKEVEGLLYKPEGFDPNKKYPMMVYFYRLHSDRLHSHYTPRPSRSIINPIHYVSNDYLVFMPNIHYKVGYPGQSAYNHVVSGTLAMIGKGFVDKDNIGIQGQSWGGYQVAYIVTQTDMYKAANSGAPVSNMTSAYGGIRWGTGMSRMFQYEETQSRLGGTLWDKPLRYIENSPVFYADKINTPLMIRHCDADGAVPWYQGIEMFVAMRRLNKPAWMLNYNGAPHNLTANRANQMDFTIRMKQFFDYYLKGEPAPKWLIDGIPAVDKGYDMGFELKKKE